MFQKVCSPAIVDYGRLSLRYLDCGMRGFMFFGVFLIPKEIIIVPVATGMLKVANLISSRVFSVENLTFGKKYLCRTFHKIIKMFSVSWRGS